jgi:hypothetical protein
MEYAREVMGNRLFEITHNRFKSSKSFAVIIGKAELRPEQLKYYVEIFCSCNNKKFLAIKHVIDTYEEQLTPIEMLQKITTTVFVEPGSDTAYYVKVISVVPIKTKTAVEALKLYGLESNEILSDAPKKTSLITTAVGFVDMEELYDEVAPNYKLSTFKIYLKDAKYDFTRLYRTSKPSVFSNHDAAKRYGTT